MSKIPAWDVTREIRVKAEDEIASSYGCSPESRSIQQHIRYGIIVLDKISGPTSHEVVSWVKKLLELDKAGHGGTLDPKVTGVLPTALQNSTRIVQALLESGKEYVCVMRTHSQEKESTVKSLLDEFQGELFQRPPLRSSVRRRLRTRYIYNIDFIEGDGRNWLFKVACQSGTYIRKLCYDVGEVLGSGAHMQELRRIRSGPFTEEQAITMYDLVEAIDLWKNGDESSIRSMIHTIEEGLSLLPKIWVRDSAVEALCNGASLALPGVLRYNTGILENDMVAVMTQKDEAIAIMRAELSSGKVQAEEHGIVASPIRVILPRGIYPRKW